MESLNGRKSYVSMRKNAASALAATTVIIDGVVNHCGDEVCKWTGMDKMGEIGLTKFDVGGKFISRETMSALNLFNIVILCKPVKNHKQHLLGYLQRGK